MRLGLSVSTVGHAAIIAWGMIGLASIDPYEVESQKPLPVDIVSVEDFTEITAGTRDGEAKAEPAAPKPVEEPRPAEKVTPEPKPARDQSAAPEPAPPPVKAEVEPAPEPLRTVALPPEPAPQEAAKPEPRPMLKNAPVPTARPKVVQKPTPEPPKPQQEQPRPKNEFDADSIAALLNKVPDAGGALPADTFADTPSLGAPNESARGLSISEIDALRRQIARCWSPPIGVLDAGRLVVRLGMHLNPDGSLTAPPQVLNGSGDPIFTIAAEAAVRAVAECQPYSLPAEKYDLWQQIHVNFDPREILGG